MRNQKTEAKKVTLKAGLMSLVLCSVLLLCPARAHALDEAPDPGRTQE